MVASREMRAIRDLPLAAPLLLVGFALFFGGAAQNGSLPWLGGGALLLVVVLLAVRGVPQGWPILLPFAALVAWLALSISWSTLPDRSWDYANRGLVYLLFAAVGLWLAGRRRELALGLAALLGAVAVWALLGKVLPFLYPDYERAARLRGPVGLWNQLALLAAFALPLALWRRRTSGALLAYAWIVALVLTYSRGGLATAVVVVGAWFILTDERAEGAATLVAAVVPAAAVVGIAFVLPGVTSDGQSSATRWRDGLIVGALLLAGAIGAAALARAPRPRLTAGVRRGLLAFGALVLVGVVAVGVLKTGSSTARPGPAAPRLCELELPLRLVAPGGARLGAPPPRGHRRRHVRADQPALPGLVPRQDDRAAQPAAPVPDGGGRRRPAAVRARVRSAPAPGVATAARARARARADPAGLSRARARGRRLGLRRGLGPRVPRGRSARRRIAAAPRLALRCARGRRRRAPRPGACCCCRGSASGGRATRSGRHRHAR